MYVYTYILRQLEASSVLTRNLGSVTWMWQVIDPFGMLDWASLPWLQQMLKMFLLNGPTIT